MLSCGSISEYKFSAVFADNIMSLGGYQKTSFALYSKTILNITSLIAFHTVKMKGEIVFFLRCTRLPRLPSFTLLYCSKAVLQEHGSVCVFFPLLAICRCAKVFLEAKWAEKNNEKASFYLYSSVLLEFETLMGS